MDDRQPSASAVCVLPDNRALGYAEYGPSGGTPMMFFHGTPGARNVLRRSDPLLNDFGIRVIVPERPGYGLSTPHARRTFRTWAKDVRTLADHLELERFAVAGASGGGPYALACAYALPDRVTSAALICSAAPFNGWRDLRHLSPLNVLKFAIPRYLPVIVRVDIAAFAPLLRRWPHQAGRRIAQLSPGDRAAIGSKDREHRISALLREAFRSGGEGLISDLVIGSRPWGFELSDIQVPVTCWHGADDEMAPLWMLERVVSKIPGADLRVIPNAGHLIVDHPEVWPSVLKRAAKQHRSFPPLPPLKADVK